MEQSMFASCYVMVCPFRVAALLNIRDGGWEVRLCPIDVRRSQTERSARVLGHTLSIILVGNRPQTSQHRCCQARSSALGNHFKSGQRLSVQNRPTEGARNVDVLPRHPLFRQVYFVIFLGKDCASERPRAEFNSLTRGFELYGLITTCPHGIPGSSEVKLAGQNRKRQRSIRMEVML
jgi:hypothetical protein